MPRGAKRLPGEGGHSRSRLASGKEVRL